MEPPWKTPEATLDAEAWRKWVAHEMQGLGPAVRYYIALESTWQVGLYVICFRFKPLVPLMESNMGRAAIARMGEMMKRWNFDAASKFGANVYNSPWKRAVAEWAFINKALAPVSFPAKIYLARDLARRSTAKGQDRASVTCAVDE